MVRYMTMKRITQILASILFVISVLTIYLAFDFAISNAVAHKTSPHKRIHHTHDHDHNHEHEHNEIKITKKRSITLPMFHYTRKLNNQTNKHHHKDDHGLHLNSNNQQRHMNNVKSSPQAQVRAKPSNFQKGKTGVKVNKPRKVVKEQKRRLSNPTMQLQNKDKHYFNDKKHV